MSFDLIYAFLRIFDYFRYFLIGDFVVGVSCRSRCRRAVVVGIFVIGAINMIRICIIVMN